MEVPGIMNERDAFLRKKSKRIGYGQRFTNDIGFDAGVP